ncbi:MAG TPA: TIGR01777 family oxidoreductase [Acidimicrobiales bacterium]|nr:TIGR01777 family oxidoreductase [Acidimicrobiales bacterium]
MRVLVSGSSGLIGRALCASLARSGHEVRRLVRTADPTAADAVGWDPRSGAVDRAGLEGTEAVVHLAGAGIGDRRWTAGRKIELLSSRVEGTAAVVAAVSAMDPPPAVLVSASAIGFYGDRGEEELTEESTPGSGFLADLCRRWEAAAGEAEAAGIRVVLLRSGIVLAPRGGALGRQLPLFRAGLGGRLGSGRQWTSWISLDDEVRVVEHALADEALRGPVNAVAPAPVRNREFTAELGRALHRPAVLAVPAPVLRLALGRELVDEALLASQRVRPAALATAGFAFGHPTLPEAFAAVL